MLFFPFGRWKYKSYKVKDTSGLEHHSIDEIVLKWDRIEDCISLVSASIK